MTPTPRFHKTGKDTFFGEWFYKKVIEGDHFLVGLQRLIDWETLTDQLIELYQGKGLWGRPPYRPSLVFKMLFVSYLYGVSEREVEELARYHLAIKWFVGLAADEAPPDHSTLTKFKSRLIKGGDWGVLEEIFDGILGQAREQGIELGNIQVVDSVHTVADVNHEKDRKRQEKKGKPPRDPDSQIVNKGMRRVVGPDGRETTKQIRYKGYKTHVSVNAETGLVTSVLPARGNTADNKAFPQLLAHDQALRLPTTTYGGDRAYDDTDIHGRIEAAGLHSGICLNDYRTQKKDANKQRWLALVETPEHQAAVKVRYRVEEPFGIAKRKHCFACCRYLGLLRYGIQSFLSFMVLNCKRIIKLLTGLTFRPLAKGKQAEVFTPIHASLPWA